MVASAGYGYNFIYYVIISRWVYSNKYLHLGILVVNNFSWIHRLKLRSLVSLVTWFNSWNCRLLLYPFWLHQVLIQTFFDFQVLSIFFHFPSRNSPCPTEFFPIPVGKKCGLQPDIKLTITQSNFQFQGLTMFLLNPTHPPPIT